MMSVGVTCAVVSLAAGHAAGQTAFVNFELPPVHGLDVTPDGVTLIAANTADERIEIFDLSTGWPRLTGSVAVGLSPVTVRARTSTEVWVVNRLSDSISIVDLTTRNVVKTLFPGDEPTDVVFAGTPARAFVALTQPNQVKVYDLADLSVAPTTIAITGQDPTSLATDGTTVFVGIRTSGNKTTVLAKEKVSEIDGPYLGQNPPPNAGTDFVPAINPMLPPAPPVGLIVRKIGSMWMDDNGADWSSKVTWDIADHDVAMIDAASLSVSYAGGIMTSVMGIAVNPMNGRVAVVGTEAINDIRFEPNVKSQFVRVHGATFHPSAPTAVNIADLNPHLSYTSASIPQTDRDRSLGDPRSVAWGPTGNRIFVTGMGSDHLLVVDQNLAPVNPRPTAVGKGPTSLKMNPELDHVYVLNRFEGTISVVRASTAFELGRVAYFDPTPAVVKDGRPFLYDTTNFSGLGQVSCGSCHIDGHMDALAWDLGAPNGSMIVAPESDCAETQPPSPHQGACPDFHPMKGPMTTQTLAGIVGGGPMHWRGDRATLAAFNVAFPGLLGADAQISATEMQQFEDFVGTIRFQPNPNRTFSDLLPSSIPGIPGNPIAGQNIMFINGRVGGTISCVTCHQIQTGGTDRLTVPGNFLGEVQTFKTPHLRNIYRKTGFDKLSQANTLGFGFLHDGTNGTLREFLSHPIFTFPAGATGDTERDHVAAFMLAFPTGTHAAVGAQLTVDGFNNNLTATINRLNEFITVANTNNVGLVARGIVGGERRGFQYTGSNTFQSDRAAQTFTATTLRTGALPGAEITFTMVPIGSQRRIGIDRDADGFFDMDEVDACSNPANASIIPGGPGAVLAGDADGNRSVGLEDIAIVSLNWGQSVTPGTGGDTDGDGVIGLGDLAVVITHWGETCGM